MDFGIPALTVIIPCRNEEKFIGRCLDSVVANDYPKDRLEVLVIDGMSEDRTREIANSYVRAQSYIRVLDNPQKIVPAALNLGVSRAKGEVIMRMDAHTVFPPDYMSQLVGWLEKSRADCVGGIWVTKPADETPTSRAIAVGMSHPFGVGNSYFRTGASAPRSVDTVPFGCYRRQVFDRIGMFDEELVRNQDDEFNHRLIRNGGRIMLIPKVSSQYYARESLRKLWRMYFQYGYFKPLAVRKIGKVMTVRQLAPMMLILALIGSGFLAPWWQGASLVFVILAGGYGLTDLICSSSAAFRHGIRCALALCVVFPVLHFSYGLGYLKGVLDFLVLRRKPVGGLAGTPITR